MRNNERNLHEKISKAIPPVRPTIDRRGSMPIDLFLDQILTNMIGVTEFEMEQACRGALTISNRIPWKEEDIKRAITRRTALKPERVSDHAIDSTKENEALQPIEEKIMQSMFLIRETMERVAAICGTEEDLIEAGMKTLVGYRQFLKLKASNLVPAFEQHMGELARNVRDEAKRIFATYRETKKTPEPPTPISREYSFDGPAIVKKILRNLSCGETDLEKVETRVPLKVLYREFESNSSVRTSGLSESQLELVLSNIIFSSGLQLVWDEHEQERMIVIDHAP